MVSKNTAWWIVIGAACLAFLPLGLALIGVKWWLESHQKELLKADILRMKTLYRAAENRHQQVNMIHEFQTRFTVASGGIDPVTAAQEIPWFNTMLREDPELAEMYGVRFLDKGE